MIRARVASAALGTLGVVVSIPALAQLADIDIDSDLVPDAVDNCVSIRNGPNELSNQVDTDQDGYGNACDADFDQSLLISGADFTPFRANFNTEQLLCDLDGDGRVSGSDFTLFIQFFGFPPGPSGLACAGTVPCLP